MSKNQCLDCIHYDVFYANCSQGQDVTMGEDCKLLKKGEHMRRTKLCRECVHFRPDFSVCHKKQQTTVYGGCDFLEVKEAMKKEETQKEDIRNPSYYTRLNPQVYEIWKAWGLDAFQGAAVAYIARAGHKGDKKEDITKAIRILELYIKE